MRTIAADNQPENLCIIFVRDVEQLNAHALKARGQEKIVNTLVETRQHATFRRSGK